MAVLKHGIRQLKGRGEWAQRERARKRPAGVSGAEGTWTALALGRTRTQALLQALGKRTKLC